MDALPWPMWLAAWLATALVQWALQRRSRRKALESAQLRYRQLQAHTGEMLQQGKRQITVLQQELSQAKGKLLALQHQVNLLRRQAGTPPPSAAAPASGAAAPANPVIAGTDAQRQQMLRMLEENERAAARPDRDGFAETMPFLD